MSHDNTSTQSGLDVSGDGLRTYFLSAEMDGAADMVVLMSSHHSLQENLTRIIPAAVARGFLPSSCATEAIELSVADRVLSLESSLHDQGVRPNELLLLRVLESTSRLEIRMYPDSCEAVDRSVYVDNRQPLGKELDGFVESVGTEYRFHGRKMRKYRLVTDSGKLDLSRSLASQCDQKAVKVDLRPKVWFEWPPGLYYPTGPYTTYSIFGAILLVVALILWAPWQPKPITSFAFSLACSESSKILCNNGAPEADSVFSARLDTGQYSFRIFPRDYPMFDTVIRLSSSDIAGDTVRTRLIVLDQMFRERAPVELRVSGYIDGVEPPRFLDSNVFILVNRFAYRVSSTGPVLRRHLPEGQYEVKYDLPDRLYRGVFLNQRKSEQAAFHFNHVTDTTDTGKHVSLAFRYAKSN